MPAPPPGHSFFLTPLQVLHRQVKQGWLASDYRGDEDEEPEGEEKEEGEEDDRRKWKRPRLDDWDDVRALSFIDL